MLQNQLNRLYDLLLKRMLDLSSYIRSKVFTILSRFCVLPVKFPKQRLTIMRAVVAALKEMDEDPLQCTQLQSTQPLISMMLGSMQASAAKKSDDMGDAFELSQLLFMVGHVAVKHIVYLELVEREWRQQRQEKELGKYIALLYIAGSLMSGFYLFSREACQGCWG